MTMQNGVMKAKRDNLFPRHFSFASAKIDPIVLARIREIAATPTKAFPDISHLLGKLPVTFLGRPIYNGDDVGILVDVESALAFRVHQEMRRSAFGKFLASIEVPRLIGFVKSHAPKDSSRLLICGRWLNGKAGTYFSGNRLCWLDDAYKLVRIGFYQSEHRLFAVDDFGPHRSFERIHDPLSARRDLDEFSAARVYELNVWGHEANTESVLWTPMADSNTPPFFISRPEDPMTCSQADSMPKLTARQASLLKKRIRSALLAYASSVAASTPSDC